MTSKQKLARIRNWNKRRISAVQANVNQLSNTRGDFAAEGLSKKETITLKLVNKFLVEVLNKWDNNSRELGLKPRGKKDEQYYI